MAIIRRYKFVKKWPFILVICALILIMSIIFFVQRSFSPTLTEATSGPVENPSSFPPEVFPEETQTFAPTASPQVAPTSPITPSAIYLIQFADKFDEAQQARFIAALTQTLGHPVEVVYQYKTVFNGLAVKLTPAEALKVSRMAGVRRVQPDASRYPQQKENSIK